MTLARRLLLAGGGASFVAPASTHREALYNGQNGDGIYAIGAASFDGTTWTRYGSNPVLVKGAGGAWDDDHVKDPWLIWDGSQYLMYYSGYDGAKYQIGLATASAHTGPWTKDGANPVLTVGSGGAFDDSGCLFPVVLRESATDWKMWYGAFDGTSVFSVGYATSTDGVAWTKVGEVLSKGGAGTWDDEGVVPAGIITFGPTYYLFYGGRQSIVFSRWQTGLATFTDPEGSYTKDAGNPLIEARFNDAGTSADLTGTTAASAVVTIADTSPFNVGEPVVITDSDTDTEVHRIASIDSGTQITLVSATTGTFTVAQGAKIRPVAFNSTQSRSVLPVAGGYEIFGVPFQPVDDLTTPSPKLREASFRWTASALTGPWSYDYATGLLFPLAAPGGVWDSISAENPSVIVAP